MGRRPKKLSRRLWDRYLDIARASERGSFVQRLGAGTLPCDRFRAYIAQDAYFLEAFARAYARAAAAAPDREGLRAFTELLNGVMTELQLHARYARSLNINLARVRPIRATTDYTTFLLDVAATGRVGEICAAMTPCMRLYAWLGQRLKREALRRGVKHPYRVWIETYASPGFEDLARTLERLLDHYARDTAGVRANYRRALKLERDFFAANA